MGAVPRQTGDHHGDHRHLHPRGRQLHRRDQDPQLNVKATIKPAEKANDKAPDYRIFAGAIEFGAAWKKTSGEGRDYLSVKLDDPSFPAPIYATLVEAEEAGSYSLIWSRRSGD